jgi:hypothetical protein
MRVLFSLLFLVSVVAPAHSREWSDATGKFRIQAKLKNVADGKVELLTDDGRDLSVPLEKLTEADRQYANLWLKRSDGKPPKLPPNAVVVADYRMVGPDGSTYSSDNTRVAVVRWPKVSQPIILSCTDPFAHEALGIDLDYLQKSVSRFEILSAVDRRPLGKATGPVPLKGVMFPGNDEKMPHGCVAFYLDAKTKAGVLLLADASPEVGDKVWALTAGEQSTKGASPLLPGTVSSIAGNKVIIKYDDKSIKAEPCLGAIFVNFAGEVAGMQTGHLGLNGAISMKVEHIRDKFKAALDK